MEAIHEITHLFEPISLAEMDGVKLMNRVDTKFAFSFEQFKTLLPLLTTNYKILEILENRIPSYESLYFDSPTFSFYKDHHNGKTNRFKVRIRKYVESNLFFLEIKHKQKGRTDKKRIVTEGFNHELTAVQREFLTKHRVSSCEIQATLWNSFRRITLVNKHAEERLTFDFKLHFYWEKEDHVFNNLVIAELKQSNVNRNSAFYELMKKQNIRPYRLSKYCIGAIELYGKHHLKYNRFKEKLIKLKSINAHVA